MTTLTINVHETPRASLPASLESRLKGSDPKSPEALASCLKANSQRTALLREAHIEAVRDRAARESQRAAEAKLRLLRLNAHKVEKVEAKTKRDESRFASFTLNLAAKSLAAKTKRDELAMNVADARRAAADKRSARSAALLRLEKKAASLRSKTIQGVVAKGSYDVKHALAVAAAHKEQIVADALAAGLKLTEKLESASNRRFALAPAPASVVLSPAGSTTAATYAAKLSYTPRLHRVLNDEKVASAMRKKLHDAAMEKAAGLHESHLESVKEKARKVTEKHAAVVLKNLEIANGTDGATQASKAALYEKLLKADVARLTSLKQKTHTAAGSAKKGDTVSVIVVKVEKEHIKTPPPALTKRLSAVSKRLLMTSAARQRGAAARRAMRAAKRTFLLAFANERRATALERVNAALAETAALSKAKASRAIVTLGLQQGRALFAVAAAQRKTADAASRRQALSAALAAKGTARLAAGAAATERHAAKLRATAKTGVVAVRAAAFKSRREAQAMAISTRGEALAQKGVAAAERRAALLSAKVAVAKKRMVAKHPKREVADMEIKD